MKMTPPIFSTSSAHAANRRAPRSGSFLAFLGLLAIISLSCGCDLFPPGSGEPVNPVIPVAPADPGKLVGIGFNRSDCENTGIIFPDITDSYIVDEINDGPYIMCNLSSQGAHGSIQASIGITAFQADKLGGFYQNQKATIKAYVDQSTEWNAQPDMPEEVKDVISILYDDVDGYVFMITSGAYKNTELICFNGYGYGTMILFDKYLANIQYSSCELADTAAYVAMMQKLQTMAMVAALNVEVESGRGK
jgi:hypothetical protein